MNKKAPAGWLLAFLLGVGGAVVFRLRDRPSVTHSRTTDVLPVLDRRTGSCDFKNVPLDDALEQLSVRTRCTIRLDWDSLNYLWSSPHVGLGFDDLPLSKAINLLLWNVTDSADELAVWEDTGVVYISLHGEPAWQMELPVTRVYDIHDIVYPGEGGLAVDPPDVPMVPPQTLPGWGLFGGGPAQYVPIVSGPYGARRENVQGLVYLIEQTVEPASWKEFGGRAGSIKEAAHLLIICQTPGNHRRIELLLGRLREARAANNRNAPPVIGGVDILSQARPARAIRSGADH